jgi:hypothetical protein
MGLTVKDLLNHLRTRQERLGVNAFNFHHVLRNNKLEPAAYPEAAQRIIAGETEMADGNATDQSLKANPAPLHAFQSAAKSMIKMEPDAAPPMELDKKADHAGISHPSSQVSSKSPWNFDTNSTPHYPIMPPTHPMPHPMFQPHFPLPWGQMPGSMPAPAATPAFNPPTHADQNHVAMQSYPFTSNHHQYMQYWGQPPSEMKPAGILNGTDQGRPMSDPVFGNVDCHLLPPGPPVFAQMPGFSTGTNQWQPQLAAGPPGMPITSGTSKPLTSPKKRGTTNQSPTKKTPKKSTKLDDATPSSTPSRSNRVRKPTQKLLDSKDTGM